MMARHARAAPAALLYGVDAMMVRHAYATLPRDVDGASPAVLIAQKRQKLRCSTRRLSPMLLAADVYHISRASR